MYPVIKRWLDITVSLLVLVFGSPLFLLIALFIWIDSPGAVLFKQPRVGRNGRSFLLYKFRSMKNGTPQLSTEEMTEPHLFVTRPGKWLRRTSLDELPQFLNILKGDMSLVGPRPALFSQTRLNELRVRWQVDRVRPGLTGMAQTMGRDVLSDRRKARLDRFYATHASLRLDGYILLRTVSCVLRAEDIKG